MPHRKLDQGEMAAAQKLFDRIMEGEYGGSPDEGESFSDYAIRVWERCAAAVIEPPPVVGKGEGSQAHLCSPGVRRWQVCCHEHTHLRFSLRPQPSTAA